MLRSDLGNPPIDDVGAMMRAAADYASAQGYAAAFPTFIGRSRRRLVYGMV